ncbi:MAG TPA: amidase [Terriglobia bacterium]|nr:amidase [Terriglobia bacterium]
MNELLHLSARGMARAIREKKFSSLELIHAHIERIEAVNPKLNAVVQLSAERALAEARTADAQLVRGEIKGPLHGVPVTFKDAIETEGIISTGGTLGRRQFVPRADAEIVKRLRAAGAIVLGKTNCPELGWAWESDNLIYGRTSNPYNHALSPGGSSGGESAIIAAGGSPLGFGSDAGGSVRFPAHCCGIASIKPTSGRVPRTGHFPGPGGMLDALWQIGPLARNVEDLELALDIISGVDWRDAAIVPMPLGKSDHVDLKKLRVAFHTDNGIVAPEQEITEAVRKAAAALSEAGAFVEETLPPPISETYEIYRGLFCADGGAGLKEILKSAGTEQVHPLLQQALDLQQSHAMSISDFGSLMARWDKFRSAMLTFMKTYDAVLSPVCSFAGMMHGSTYDRLPSFSYTMTYNLTGWPAAVVRSGNSMEGLPIGVQVAARPWQEHLALAVARRIEEALGGWQAPQI